MKQTLIKDCEVEVCSNEEGFKDSWFRAILKENPKKLGRRKKLRVCYMTLLHEDGVSPLIENVDKKLIRPVPPEVQYDSVVFVEGLVVDAYRRDGWWTGLVIKKLEDDKFLVYFDSPPDVIQLERNQLRPHFDLIGSQWVQPDIKKLGKSMFSPGTIVETSSLIENVEVMWVPVMIVTAIEVCGETKFIVKASNTHLRCNGDEPSPTMTVGLHNVRPTPPPFSVEEYKLLECVEVFRGLCWRQGFVTRILSDKRYIVSLEATKEEAVFEFSDLRPFKVWEDGVWHFIPKKEPEEETPSNFIQMKPLPSSLGAGRSLNPEENGETLNKAEILDATGEVGKGKAIAVMNDNTPGITPKVTSIAKESVSLGTPSPVINATPLKRIEAETQDRTLPKKTIQLVRNQNGLGNDSTQEKEDSENNNRKRKRDVANVEETKADETTMVSPFEKKLPVWKKLESMEVVPQAPHFTPLVKTTEISREMSAVGMTLTYHDLLKEVKDLQLFTPISTLKRLSDYFAELEKHGFDVKAPLMRIQKLLSLIDRQEKKMEELEGVEKEIAEKENDKVEIKQKILELQREEEEADKEIAQMNSCVTTIGQQLEDVELQFQTTVSAPW